MATELLNCPFCGGQAAISRETLDERYAYANVVKVQCKGCGVSVSAMGDTSKRGYADNSTTEARAIEKWNRRATHASQEGETIPQRVTPGMVAHMDSTLDMLEKSRARMDALSEKYGIREAEARDAARWRYIEEHATTHGGGNGFTITCFVPVDEEDMGCGIDAAIEAQIQGKEQP